MAISPRIAITRPWEEMLKRILHPREAIEADLRALWKRSPSEALRRIVADRSVRYGAPEPLRIDDDYDDEIELGLTPSVLVQADGVIE
jgi:hypothetical protein